MAFKLLKSPKYKRKIKYFIKNNFQELLNKIAEIESILGSGLWLEQDIKKQYKIKKMSGYENYWKCKYIYKWRLVFAVDDNIITLIDLDRRDTIYNFLRMFFNF